MSWPFILPFGDPEPRLTALARGPFPVLPLFMPGIPAFPRLTLETAGPERDWRGLVDSPRRTALG